MKFLFVFLTLGSMLLGHQTPAEKSIERADKLLAESDDPLTPAQKSVYKVEQQYSQTRVTIKEILSGGRIVVLDDNSRWIVKPSDYIFSGGWLSPAYVRIKLDGLSTDEYPYTMRNLSTKQTIRVQKL